MSRPLPILDDHVERMCRPGKGVETCSYLTRGSLGWQCAKGSDLQSLIDARRSAHAMKSMGDNCDGPPSFSVREDKQLPTNSVMVPDLCDRHLHELVVRRLKLAPSDGWRAKVIIAQILLFQWTATDPRFWRRCGKTVEERDRQAMNIVLAEIGCLACYSPRGFSTIWRMIRDDLDGAVAASKVWNWAEKHFTPESA
jgi:hypothetical protein